MATKYYYIKAKSKKPLSLFNLFKIAICLLIFIVPLYFLTNLFTQTTQAYISPVAPQTANSEIYPTNTPTPTVVLQEIIPKPTSTPTIMPTETPIASPTPYVPKKKTYSIAIFGDSMIDTMGEALEYLGGPLKNRYPQTEFKLYNYGLGSQNVSQGLNRLCQEFNYKDRHYPSLCAIKPDL